MKKNKTYLRTMSLILVFLITLSTVVVAITIISWPNELTAFEEYNPVYSEYVELGTALEDTSLPESVRGIVDIPDDMDISTFTQVEPTVDSSTGTEYYDYYDYGYVRSSDSVEKYENNELVIYSIFYADDDGTVEEIAYRVYGYLENSTTVWFTCDIDGNITGAILDVPVEWTGDYDSETYGEYTFTAKISEDSSYTYKGDMPTASIVVYDYDSVDCGHDGDCDCTTETVALSHIETASVATNANTVLSVSMEENYDESEESSESSSENFSNSISLMSLDNDIMSIAEVPTNNSSAADYTTNSYTSLYGDGTATEIIMANLISDYVTSSISTSGNDGNDNLGVSGDWIDYLNTMWYNIVGGITDSGTEATDSVWTSNVTWVDTTEDGFDGTFVDGQWYGTGDSDTLIYVSTSDESNKYLNDEGFYTWKVYVGEQLLYALLHYESGDTIEFQNDIDLNGQYYCWPDIELTESLTINGNDYTIYNLSAFIEYSADDDSTRSGFISFSAGWDENPEYVIKDLNFDTGKIYADTGDSDYTSVNLSLFGIESSAVSVEFDDIHIENYLVCSNAAAVSVFVSVGLAADWSDTTEYTTGYDVSVDSGSTFTYTSDDNKLIYDADFEFTSYEDYEDYEDDGSTLDDYIQMDDYDFKITANNCSVSDSYVYGTDHVGSMGSYTSMSFTNCYAVGNVLVGTGYHSGSFVSCLNNAGYFENCFAADNYLYSASQSGGFVGYSGDSADYVNCYASGIVEGYSSIGGFVGTTRVGHDYVAATITEIETSGTTTTTTVRLYNSDEKLVSKTITNVVVDSNDNFDSKTVSSYYITTSDDDTYNFVTTISTEYTSINSDAGKTETTTKKDYGSAYITETVEYNPSGDATYSYSYISRNYSTFTNCYSTTLVGMRTETTNSGGFVGLVAYMENYNPTAAAVFDSCYAAGEVGSTQTVTDTNENYLGGFVGYDQTYTEGNEGDYETIYTNCYYDKQTTAMREWVSGRYNSTDEGHIYQIDITGVLTSDSDKYGTGLISEPASYEVTVDDDKFDYGFTGFTNANDWVYTTEEHYPELSVFANASSADWANPELVKAYSKASTATVILDTWDYGYTWDSEGIRSDSKELYYGTYDGLEDHVADRYTYDTVREVVSNATITDTAIFDEMTSLYDETYTGGLITQSYEMASSEYMLMYDTSQNIIGYYDFTGFDEIPDESTWSNYAKEMSKDEMISSGIMEVTDYHGVTAFDLDNDSDSLTVTAPGIDWYEIEETVDGETGYRPIRLISFMNVDAGDDYTGDDALSASDLYDHKDDAYFTMVDTIKQNMIIALDYAEAWSTSLMQIYPETEEFYAVDTEATNFTASDSAWINTEIWRAEVVTWDLTDEDFKYVESTDTYYYTDKDGTKHEFYTGQDGVIYYYEDGDLTELYASETAEDGTVSYYTADYSVKVSGTVEGDTSDVTQDKWNGEIPLYPDLGETQYYIVRYYWVLGNGRYRSDYKIIEISADEIDVNVSHDVTINVYNDDATDDTEATINETALAVNAGSDNDKDDLTYLTIEFDETASNTDTEEDVGYGVDSYVSWVQMNDSTFITKLVLTMTSNADALDDDSFIIGTATVDRDVDGAIEVGTTITIPIKTYYLEYTYEGQDEDDFALEYDDDGNITNAITGQSTKYTETNVEYTIQKDEATGGLYLEFSNSFKDPDSTTVIFDDTAYNIIVDIYVQEGSVVTVTKDISNYDENIDDGMDEQSFIINLTGGIETDVVLTNDETSDPIYVQASDGLTFFVDETVPMEFELEDITYTVNGGDSIDYTSAGITIEQGDVIAITVTNEFTEESYFKARDEVNNEFTYNYVDETD